MQQLSKVADVITFPARTVVGVASLGVRTTVRVLGWAAEQVAGQPPARSEPVRPQPVTEPTHTVAAKKVPASQVPLKSAPTPSLTPALAMFDELDDVPEPASTRSRKAPSKKAAVLAPALGLSESEVEETETLRQASDADKG